MLIYVSGFPTFRQNSILLTIWKKNPENKKNIVWTCLLSWWQEVIICNVIILGMILIPENQWKFCRFHYYKSDNYNVWFLEYSDEREAHPPDCPELPPPEIHIGPGPGRPQHYWPLPLACWRCRAGVIRPATLSIHIIPVLPPCCKIPLCRTAPSSRVVINESVRYTEGLVASDNGPLVVSRLLQLFQCSRIFDQVDGWAGTSFRCR